MQVHGIPCAAGKRRVTFSVFFDYQGRRDPQNYLMKGMIDAMARVGLLVKDDADWVELSLPKIGLEIGNGHTDFLIEDINGPDLL
jgi:Holliday junction resolvase RusA-like endonuclease